MPIFERHRRPTSVRFRSVHRNPWCRTTSARRKSSYWPRTNTDQWSHLHSSWSSVERDDSLSALDWSVIRRIPWNYSGFSLKYFVPIFHLFLPFSSGSKESATSFRWFRAGHRKCYHDTISRIFLHWSRRFSTNGGRVFQVTISPGQSRGTRSRKLSCTFSRKNWFTRILLTLLRRENFGNLWSNLRQMKKCTPGIYISTVCLSDIKFEDQTQLHSINSGFRKRNHCTSI